jgi:hypothetical protein
MPVPIPVPIPISHINLSLSFLFDLEFKLSSLSAIFPSSFLLSFLLFFRSFTFSKILFL